MASAELQPERELVLRWPFHRWVLGAKLLVTLTQNKMSFKSNLVCHVIRLKPGDEVYSSLLQYKTDHHLQSPFIMTCCGSVRRATLRMAAHVPDSSMGTNEIRELEGPFEIVSLVGTLSGDDGHLHIALSDKSGTVVGGHVIGNLYVFTTAEIVIGECPQLVFDREFDSATGFPELFPRYKAAEPDP